MLLENKLSSKKILWDLNNDLPPEINKCSLLTSNFCIHWLNNPEKIIKNWFSKLKSKFLRIVILILDCPTGTVGGLMAIAKNPFSSRYFCK